MQCPTELHKIVLAIGAPSPQTSLSLGKFTSYDTPRPHHLSLFWRPTTTKFDVPRTDRCRRQCRHQGSTERVMSIPSLCDTSTTNCVTICQTRGWRRRRATAAMTLRQLTDVRLKAVVYLAAETHTHLGSTESRTRSPGRNPPSM